MDKFNNLYQTLFKFKRKLHNPRILNLIRRHYCESNNSGTLNLLFFGNDKFSLKSLQLLNEAKFQSKLIQNIDVVTSSNSKSNTITKFAIENNLRCYNRITAENIAQQQYDLGIVVSFGHLIQEDIINAFPRGIINVHASLLPKWRGAAPIIYSIMHGDKETGVSIMKIHPKRFDIGEILAQKAIPIPPNVLMPDLHTTLAKLGAELLTDCVLNLDDSLKNAKPQNNDNVSFAPRIQPAITQIDWSSMTAETIRRRYRALYSFKELTTTFNNMEIKIHEICLNEFVKESTTASMPAGFVEYVRSLNCLKVFCINGESVLVKKLAVKGKKTMNANEFTNGFINKVDVSDRYFM